jgi:hypothetical protein
MKRFVATRWVAATLALVLSVAPALAARTGCCQRGAAAVGESSRCGCCQRAPSDAARPEPAPASCCASQGKSCCAQQAEHEPSPQNDPAPQTDLAAESSPPPCCCRSNPSIPATSETQTSRFKHDLIPSLQGDGALPSTQHLALDLLHRQGEILPAPSLQILLCRWVV